MEPDGTSRQGSFNRAGCPEVSEVRQPSRADDNAPLQFTL